MFYINPWQPPSAWQLNITLLHYCTVSLCVCVETVCACVALVICWILERGTKSWNRIWSSDAKKSASNFTVLFHFWISYKVMSCRSCYRSVFMLLYQTLWLWTLYVCSLWFFLGGLTNTFPWRGAQTCWRCGQTAVNCSTYCVLLTFIIFHCQFKDKEQWNFHSYRLNITMTAKKIFLDFFVNSCHCLKKVTLPFY